MFNAMTFDFADPGQTACFHPHHPPVDILCCQSIWRTIDTQPDATGQVAAAWRLAPGCFVATPGQQRGNKQHNAQSIQGFAIFTGPETWMLNSGSIQLHIERHLHPSVIQFAVIRKLSSSLLILNLNLPEKKRDQEQLFSLLFAHSLLKERYGAVLLCAGQHGLRPQNKLQALSRRSAYQLVHPPLPSGPTGCLCLFHGRMAQSDEVTLSTELLESIQTAQAAIPPMLRFEMTRRPREPKTRPVLPLSFREQWIGYKDQCRAFAA